MTVLEQQFMSAALSYFRRKQEFVKLTEAHGYAVWINPNRITRITNNAFTDGAYVVMDGETLSVKETPEQILSQL